MEFTQVIKSVLDIGPNVLLPIIVFILGLVIGLKPAKALGSGLMLGVALTGMFVLFNFAFGSLGDAGQAMVKNTGRTLQAYDLGWTVAATISWAWPFAFLMFPLQIMLNILMLAMGWS